MPEIAITTRGGTGRGTHKHFLYMRDDMTAQMAKAKDHVHPIMFNPPRPPQPPVMDQDPMSPLYGVQLSPGDPGDPGGWAIEPVNNHSHDIEGAYVPADKGEKDQEDSKIINDVLAMFSEAKEIESGSRVRAYESDKMYMPGGQWDKKTKADLIAKQRAALEINKIESKLDNLSGYQRQNRTDFKCLPTEDGDQRVADIMNYVIKNVTEGCNYAREETKVFDDMMITGRGLFNCFTDYDRNIQGDIIVEKYRWDNCVFGPHGKEDLEDCDYLVKEKWYSLAKLKEMHPEHADKFQPESKYMDIGRYSKSEDWDQRLATLLSASGGTELSDTLKKQYKLLECWRKVYRRNFILANSEDGFVYSADNWTTDDIAAVKTIDGFRAIPRVTYRMRVTKIVVALLIDDGYPEELAINDFHVVPAYAKKRNDEFWGKIEGIKDLQSAINKAYSQFIDILNRMAAYGWFYDDETFSNREEEKKFKDNSSTPGFTQKVSNIDRLPKKEEGIKFPNELVGAITAFNIDMREILNINLEMQGLQGQTQESGVAIRQKIVQQLLGNDYIFDNLSFAKKKVGKLIIAMIQQTFTPERILRIIGNQAVKEKKMELGGKPIEEYPREELLAMLQNSDLTKYDITISESPASPTAQLSNFMFLLEMASKGVQIPPIAFFEFAPIPNKEKIIEGLQQAAQQAEAADKRKYDTEIQKSQIAAQSKAGGPTPGPDMGGPMIQPPPGGPM